MALPSGLPARAACEQYMGSTAIIYLRMANYICSFGGKDIDGNSIVLG